jgi:predicted ArsR family transcriptional regulator
MPRRRYPVSAQICRVETTGEHITIQTTPRRAEAILMVLAGATLQQVGDELGVSRERIRQYLCDAGLQTRMRVVLFSKRGEGVEAQGVRHALKRPRLLREKRNKRIRRAVRVIQRLVQTRGRPPTHRELFRALFRREPVAACSQLAAWLGRNSAQGFQMERIRALYRLAGIRGRRIGCWTSTYPVLRKSGT